MLLDIARTFNQYQLKCRQNPFVASPLIDSQSPFADFNARGNVIELLERHGWQVIRRTSLRTYLRRPGNTTHDTSGDYNHQLGLFGVFSTSTEFETGKGYKPYAVYAILECGGDFRKAAKKLLHDGYGTPYSSRI
jgi:hypothetical protein